MIRSVFGKVMWVGRAMVFLVGLAVILALMFGVASVAFTNDGRSFLLGARNVAQSVSTLVKQGAGPALSLQVGSGAPLKVNSTTKVAKLNADMVDGMDSSQLAPRAYALVDVTTDSVNFDPSKSKGILGMQRNNNSDSIYCFNLAFNNPHAAVASAAAYTNNATVGTTLSGVSGCTAPFNDAAAQTFAGNTSAPVNHVSFSIAFM